MQVTALYVYPIKACAGIALGSADVVERGLAHDRRWMIVDHAGRFITQRDVPRLCLVATALHGERLSLAAPEMPELTIPLDGSAGSAMPVEVWSHRGNARRDAAASLWFSEFLGRTASAVYMADDERRSVNPLRARPGDIVSFADGYPFLVISEESLTDLNSRLPRPIDMRRFRPNIVVSGAGAYGEDRWTRVAIGPVAFRAVKRCDRCAVTTVDPETGERGKEPLKTLKSFREEDGKVWFGMNLIHDASGTISVGDRVTHL